METSFDQWHNAKLVNTRADVSPDACKYVILMKTTKNFNVEQDLQRHLSLRNKPLVWFIKQFTRLCVRVEYADIFVQRELNHFGRIAQDVSSRIVQKLFQKTYDTQTVVAPTWIINKIWPEHKPFKTVSPETFRDWLLS